MNPKHLKNQEATIKGLPRILGENFLFFRKYYFAKHHKIVDAPFHREVAEILQELSFKGRGSQFALAAPRGSAKSTLVSLEYVLYSICNKIEPYIILASSTADQAQSLLSNIKNELTKNERLLHDFPDICETGRKPGPPRWKQDEIIIRNGVMITALGSGQHVRGRKHCQFRPSLIILDDIETDEEARNQDSYYKLYSWVTKSMLMAGDNNTNVIFLGTIHHYNSLLAQFTSPVANLSWIKRIYRSVISWSANPKLWEEWENIYNRHSQYKGIDGPLAAESFFIDHKEEMLLGTQVLWPQQRDYYKLMTMRQDNQLSFDSEMQNDPVNPRDCIFNVEESHHWEDQHGSEDELLQTLGEYGLCYGSCDPSMGKQNKHGDYSAIITAVKDTRDGTIYILDADIERRLPDKTIEAILAHHRKRNYQLFAFETNQFQEYMAGELEKRSGKEGLYLPLEQIKHSTDKRARIEALQPLIKNGTIRFSRRHHLLLEQMKYYPKGAHDDGLDALEMVVNLIKQAGEGPLAWTVDTTPSPWRSFYTQGD